MASNHLKRLVLFRQVKRR